jgi:hypothetical protein
MTTLLKIRFIQIKREIYNTGYPILILFGLLFFLIYVSFITYQTTPDAYYLTAFLLFICLSLQSIREDKAFVYSHIDKPQLEIYSEYILLTFPFAASSLFTVNWFCYPILLLALFGIPFLKYTLPQKTYFKNISSIIPASCFEWISGFRKSFLLLIPVYVLAIGFCWFKILPLFLLWLITIMVASFYNEFEPVQMLREGCHSSKRFLRQKLYRHSKYLLLLYAPVLLVNTILNFEYWVVNLLFIPVQLSLLCFAICLKYSAYQPAKSSAGNSIIFAFVSLGSVIPFLLPVPLVMAFIYYGKAKTNLNNYFND